MKPIVKENIAFYENRNNYHVFRALSQYSDRPICIIHFLLISSITVNLSSTNNMLYELKKDTFAGFSFLNFLNNVNGFLSNRAMYSNNWIRGFRDTEETAARSAEQPE